MAFAQSHDFTVNNPVMLDQSSNTGNVVNQINMITNEIMSGRLSPISQVPPSTTQMFTGQEMYLDALNKHFNGDVNDKSRKYFLLYGIGGIGKTQICLKYKDDSEDCYEYIFWIDTTSEESVVQSLKDIYKSYKAAQYSEFSENCVLSWISALKTKWLMIYDNADGAPEIVEKHLPPGNKGNILITSRNPALRKITTDKYAMEVTEMSTKSSIMLLLKSSGHESHYEQYEDVANEIVSELYGVPLAISQAGAYIMHGECGITKYLHVYRKNRILLLSNKEYGGASKYNKSVYGTWELSYQKLVEMSENASTMDAAKYAINIINISAFYHHLNIPIALFERAARNYPSFLEFYDDDTRPVFVKSMNPQLFNLYENNQWNEILFNQAMSMIISLSLVKRDSSNCFSFHPLIQQWCQDRLLKADIPHLMLISAGILATSITNENSTTEAVYLQQITLHLSTTVKKMDVTQYYEDLFQVFATASRTTGYFMNAEKLTKNAVMINEELLGQFHNETLQWMSRLAALYSDLGKFSEAESLGIQVLASQKRILGDDHPRTLQSMGNLASTYSNLGKFSDAESLEIQVLALQKRILGDDHPDTLLSMGNLASTYSNLGKFSDAENLEIQVLALRRRILGDDHPDTLLSMANLARTYSDLGKFSDAENLEIQVLTLRRRILGDDHPDTLLSMANLARTYSDLGKFSDAENLEIKVLALQRRILGDDHPDTLLSMANLARTYSDLGKFSDAENLEIKVLALQRRILGDDHPSTLQSMDNLASTYFNFGKFSDAENLAIQVLALRRRILGDDHPDTLTSIHNLAVTYEILEKWGDAQMLRAHQLEILKRRWGEEHLDTLMTMNSLLDIYSHLGKKSEVESLKRKIIEITKSMKGKDIDIPNEVQVLYEKSQKKSKMQSMFAKLGKSLKL